MVDNPITRKEKYLAKLTGSYTGNIPDPITRVEKYLYDLCQKGISGLTPEEIENAVNKYLKENPVQPGATEEQAQQIKQNTDDVASLKEDISTKIAKFYASSQGETHLADSDSGKIMDMMLYGKSEQKQYSGDNIYYMDYEDYSQTYNGARITSTKFGYSVSGTISGAGGYTLTNRYITLAPGTYKMLLKNISALKIGLSKRDYSAIATISEGKTDTTFTLDEETEVCLTIGYSNTTSNETNEIMLTKNLEATSYEPYTGGIPSPNPDYPQEIKSVVNPTVKVCGKNLWNEQWINGTLNSSGEFTSDPQRITSKDFIDVSPKTQYYSTAVENSIYYIHAYTKDEKHIDYISSNGQAFTTPDNCYKLKFVCESTYGNTYKNDIAIIKGASGNYEPYHEQTVALPYTLNAIPVSSGGNVTINGQQYVADYVDVERGKLVRLNRFKKITSNDIVSINDSKHLYAKTYDVWDSTNYVQRSLTAMSNISEAMLDTVDNSGWNGESRIRIKKVPFANIDEAKSYFETNDVYCCYPLATSTETDLTPEEIQAFKALATYYPVTNISVNSEQLDGYTVFNYPISMKNGWDYVKKQLNDNRDYIYNMDTKTQDIDTQAAEAYVNSEYAVALTELEV